MKKSLLLLLFLLLLWPSLTLAAPVTFEWDANTEPDLAGYRLYQNPVSGAHVLRKDSPVLNDEVDNIPAGTETTTIDVGPGPNYFVLTAYDSNNNESDESNEVSTGVAPDTTPPNIPASLRKVSELTISNLIVSTGKTYEVASLGNGEPVYVDRTFAFTGLPGLFQGIPYIKTANGDKGGVGDSFLSFDVNQDVTVYVGYDIRITGRPSWLLDFNESAAMIVTSDTSFNLFYKDFPPGTITLGGNNSADNSMYSVIIKN
jgi:hypothetical protein